MNHGIFVENPIPNPIFTTENTEKSKRENRNMCVEEQKTRPMFHHKGRRQSALSVATKCPFLATDKNRVGPQTKCPERSERVEVQREFFDLEANSKPNFCTADKPQLLYEVGPQTRSRCFCGRKPFSSGDQYACHSERAKP
ncbi:MAG: hypothetical protein Q7I97_03030 [Thermovirgaceae bacterium]|nr:hypothetical protein [Thermovirgaceae bacterium]